MAKSAIRRIMVSTIALIIVSILYFFPNNNVANIKMNVEYIDVNKSPIYLINKNDLLVRTTTALKSNELETQIQELIKSLIINSDNSSYIPKNLKQIIPKNTKILSIDLKDGLLKIDFSKELLNCEAKMEEQIIESLIYTLTEIKEVEKIMLFVENQKLEELPQSKIKLPNTLDRSFGINKVYDISNMKNLTKTTIYYVGKEDDLIYYTPITKIDNNNSNKIEIIIEELKSSPIYETNLISYLASSVELLNYEALENQIILSFNNSIFDDFNEKNIQEEVKYSIALSLKDSLNVDDVIFKVNDEIITTFASDK